MTRAEIKSIFRYEGGRGAAGPKGVGGGGGLSARTRRGVPRAAFDQAGTLRPSIASMPHRATPVRLRATAATVRSIGLGLVARRTRNVLRLLSFQGCYRSRRFLIVDPGATSRASFGPVAGDGPELTKASQGDARTKRTSQGRAGQPGASYGASRRARFHTPSATIRNCRTLQRFSFFS